MDSRDMTHGRGRGSGRSFRRVFVALILVALLMASLVGCTSEEDASETEEGEVTVQQAALAGGWDAVSWTGDGRFAILQTFNDQGTPVVMAWDVESGEVSEASGYVVISLEPASPIIWLEPKTAEHVAAEMLEAPEYTYLDLGPFDEPAPHIETWDPASGDVPTSDVATHYAPDEGVEYVAHFEVDPDIGGLPSGIVLSDGESRADGHEANLPDDLATFSVIGWSPSGEYVAVEELTQKDVALASAAVLDDEVVPFPERRLLVIEAASGEVVEEAAFADDVIAPAQWLGDADVLVWAVDNFDDDTYGLAALEIGGDPGEFTQVTGVELPTEMMSGSPPYPLGSGTFGLTLVTWGADGVAHMWRVDSTEAQETGTLEAADQIAWSQGGGVAMLTYQTTEDGAEEYVTVGVSDESGAPPQLAITGPSRPGFGFTEE